MATLSLRTSTPLLFRLPESLLCYLGASALQIDLLKGVSGSAALVSPETMLEPSGPAPDLLNQNLHLLCSLFL